MAWQQRAITVLKLTWNKLQSPYNMSKQSFWCQKFRQINHVGNILPKSPSTGNKSNLMLITDFSARIVIPDLSDF